MFAIALKGSAAAALIVGLSMTLATPASAQLSESGGPVSYSADALEYYDTEHRLVLSGDVDVIQGDARLRGDRVTLFFSGPGAAPTPPNPDGSQPAPSFGSGDIQRMVAEGDVYFVRPTQSARGDRAVYNTVSGQVVFTGNVVVASTDNVIRGETMTLEINTRRTIIRPAAGERVRGVLTQNASAETGASTPPAPGARN